MHGVMTDGLVSECGKFRSGEEGVFDGDRCIFMAPPGARARRARDEAYAGSCENSDLSGKRGEAGVVLAR